MESGMTEADWKGSLPHLKQARAEGLEAISKLEKTAKELRELMERNATADGNPARQKQMGALVGRITTIQRELDEIQNFIDELEAQP
jgi:predicted  nucleic acid-binding Zn-ribbon protein